jgi:hypothetical protein
LRHQLDDTDQISLAVQTSEVDVTYAPKQDVFGRSGWGRQMQVCCLAIGGKHRRRTGGRQNRPRTQNTTVPVSTCEASKSSVVEIADGNQAVAGK